MVDLLVSARVWMLSRLMRAQCNSTMFLLTAREDSPAIWKWKMTYRLENEVNALTIEYRATTDKATVVNLTNHGFFNLAGISNPTPTVNNHIVTINADFYTPIDEVSIPTGEIAKVERYSDGFPCSAHCRRTYRRQIPATDFRCRI